MPSRMGSDSVLFRTLLEQKENEIVALCEHQINLLQQQVAEKSKQHKELAERFEQLQGDFKYNLALLDDRDAELAQYDASISYFQEATKKRERQYQDTKTTLVEAETRIQQEKARAKEAEKVYHKKLKEIQDQMQNLRITQEELHSKQRHAFEATREELMRHVLQKQEQLDNQSKEIEARYLDQLHKQNLQHQMELDEAVDRVFGMETQIKQLERELEVGREREIMQKTMGLELSARMERKERQIKELISHLKQSQDEKDTLALEHDKDLRKLSDNIVKLEESHTSALAQKDALIRASELALKSLETELASSEAEKTEQTKRFKEKIRNMEEELVSLEAQEEGRIREFKRRQEQQLQNWRSEALTWKSEHDCLLSKYSDAQKELAAALVREDMLLAELAMHQKVFASVVTSILLGGIERNTWHHYWPGRGLIRSKPHSEVNNWPHQTKTQCESVFSLDTELPAPSPLQSPVSTEETPRHLSGHHMDPPQGADVKGLRLEKLQLQMNVKDLHEQNERLRFVLAVMRKEMEALQKAAVVESSKKLPISMNPEVDILQDEVQNLRSQTMAIAAQMKALHERRSETAGGGKDSEGMSSKLRNEDDKAELDTVNTTSERVATRVGPGDTVMAWESEKAIMLSQLQVAGSDILRIAKERDELMELSNALRADLNRLTPYDQGVEGPGYVTVGGSSAGRVVGKSNEQSSDRTKRSPDRTRNSVLSPQKARPDPVQKFMQLQGTSTITHERRTGSELDPLHKGTASQLLWFKSASKRREDAGKAKVRNYNIKDDDDNA